MYPLPDFGKIFISLISCKLTYVFFMGLSRPLFGFIHCWAFYDMDYSRQLTITLHIDKTLVWYILQQMHQLILVAKLTWCRISNFHHRNSCKSCLLSKSFNTEQSPVSSEDIRRCFKIFLNSNHYGSFVTSLYYYTNKPWVGHQTVAGSVYTIGSCLLLLRAWCWFTGVINI